MTWASVSAAALLASSLWGQTIDTVRKSALNYSAGLPDFFCTETVRRYRNSTSSPEWSPMDTLTVQLSYFGHREEYKLLLVNGQKTKLRYEEAGGSVSQGEFGSMLQEVFLPSAEATFAPDSQSTLRGRTVQVFRYTVSAEKAHYRLNYTANERHFSAMAGRHGLVYVGAAGDILRITSEADNLPESFPIDRLNAVLDYDYADIGGRQFLVPHAATVEMRAGILGSKNEIDFHDYRKFSADAGINFDTPIKK
ncbi:MAG TPA: hypothetical protein VG456_01410 [Candidatus Sulfopaludibacter sp.]|nr:hypothetical protein [Candidatus Sulfopaludibacter sp.]